MSETKFAHELQHPQSPTWCVHCGTFDLYCSGTKCTEDRSRKYDSSREENFVRMAESIGFKRNKAEGK